MSSHVDVRRHRCFGLYYSSKKSHTIREELKTPSVLNIALKNRVLRRPHNWPSPLIRNTSFVTALVCDLVRRDKEPMTPGTRYQPNEKPVYVCCEILVPHIQTDSGETTSASVELAKLISARGNKEDDNCGYILASELGGKMVHFNLFPQDRLIDQGYRQYSPVWRPGIEWLIKLWLIGQHRDDPMVRCQILLCYNDRHQPDRPSEFHVYIEFFKSDTDTLTSNGVRYDDDDQHVLSKGDRQKLLDDLIRNICNEKHKLTEDQLDQFTKQLIQLEQCIKGIEQKYNNNNNLQQFFQKFYKILHLDSDYNDNNDDVGADDNIYDDNNVDDYVDTVSLESLSKSLVSTPIPKLNNTVTDSTAAVTVDAVTPPTEPNTMEEPLESTITTSSLSSSSPPISQPPPLPPVLMTASNTVDNIDTMSTTPTPATVQQPVVESEDNSHGVEELMIQEEVDPNQQLNDEEDDDIDIVSADSLSHSSLVSTQIPTLNNTVTTCSTVDIKVADTSLATEANTSLESITTSSSSSSLPSLPPVLSSTKASNAINNITVTPILTSETVQSHQIVELESDNSPTINESIVQKVDPNKQLNDDEDTNDEVIEEMLVVVDQFINQLIPQSNNTNNNNLLPTNNQLDDDNSFANNNYQFISETQNKDNKLSSQQLSKTTNDTNNSRFNRQVLCGYLLSWQLAPLDFLPVIGPIRSLVWAYRNYPTNSRLATIELVAQGAVGLTMDIFCFARCWPLLPDARRAYSRLGGRQFGRVFLDNPFGRLLEISRPVTLTYTILGLATGGAKGSTVSTVRGALCSVCAIVVYNGLLSVIYE
ncbi:TNF receptor-associated factor family protein DDB_G0272098-like [Oppia nitens]|uniref:TNF receptor-associated factor family protein DDB_G0272098-like n=1 Tax=Oppia nitens TaxID=1686743 RepID=UPI0023DB077A|nr:TNF receptor-associated factor family protein DDB_G0272098-like [Oppia nitens]